MEYVCGTGGLGAIRSGGGWAIDDVGGAQPVETFQGDQFGVAGAERYDGNGRTPTGLRFRLAFFYESRRYLTYTARIEICFFTLVGLV